jgi:hypothetical protein
MPASNTAGPASAVDVTTSGACCRCCFLFFVVCFQNIVQSVATAAVLGEWGDTPSNIASPVEITTSRAPDVFCFFRVIQLWCNL